MKIISIGFKNPFHESGYISTIKINDLDDINVFIGKNNSGKTNILRYIFNLLYQKVDRSGIFRRLKVKLDYEDINRILGDYCNEIYAIHRESYVHKDFNIREHRIHDILRRGNSVNIFNPLYNLKLKVDNPFSKTFSMFLNFKFDASNQNILFNYEFENIDDLAVDLKPTIEEILKWISLDQDFVSLLIDHILPVKNVILIPSFRTLGSSEKDYQTQEITNINDTFDLLFNKSFNSIPINKPREKPFEIPNLALILNTIKRGKVPLAFRSLIGPEFFKGFNSNLRKIFPNIELSIMWNFSDQKTIGGYIEDNKEMGDWTKLGHGTQELISLLFLLMLPRDGIYIIDEPENGLHPGLQSKLLYFIKHVILVDNSYNKQFFFASHSTSFIDFAGNYSHYRCEKTKDKFSIDLFGKEDLNIIRETLGLSPSALLQANGIIWSEGPSDSFYIKMLFSLFGLDLNESGVLIISLGGGGNITNDFFSLDLLKNINPNFCIIVDSEKKDEADNISDALKNKREEFEKEGYIFLILEKFRNIEGIITQEVINEFFKINTQLTTEQLKRPFENLELYLKRLKKLNMIPEGGPKYSKFRDAPKICELIKSKPDYVSIIVQNEYIKSNIEKIKKEVAKWNNLSPNHNNEMRKDDLESLGDAKKLALEKAEQLEEVLLKISGLEKKKREELDKEVREE